MSQGSWPPPPPSGAVAPLGLQIAMGIVLDCPPAPPVVVGLGGPLGLQIARGIVLDCPPVVVRLGGPLGLQIASCLRLSWLSYYQLRGWAKLYYPPMPRQIFVRASSDPFQNNCRTFSATCQSLAGAHSEPCQSPVRAPSAGMKGFYRVALGRPKFSCPGGVFINGGLTLFININ